MAVAASIPTAAYHLLRDQTYYREATSISTASTATAPLNA